MRAGLFTMLLLTLAAACSNASTAASPPDASLSDADGGAIAASGYDHACVVASDCVTVFAGNVCDSCGCPNAAITASDQVRYDTDFDALRHACAPDPSPACSACASVVAVCNAGTCATAPCTAPDGCVTDAGSDAAAASDAADAAD